MMAMSHASTGVLLATTGCLVMQADIPTGLVALTLLPGLALMNDLDHPGATASHTFGWVTKIPSFFMAHRRETHCFPGITVIALVTWAATLTQGFWLSNIYITFVLSIAWISAMRALKITKWKSGANLLPIFPAVAIAWFPEELAKAHLHFPLDWLPLAVWLGMVTHVMGDVITRGGCPLWWPFSKKRTQLAWFKTNSRGERVALFFIVVLIGLTGWGWGSLVLAT